MKNPALIYRQTELKRRALQPRVLRMVRQALAQQIAPVLKAIEAGANGADYVNEAPIRAMMEQVYTLAGSVFAKDTYRQLTSEAKSRGIALQTKDTADVLEPIWQQFMRGYIRGQAGYRISTITANSQAKVKAVLEKAAVEGLSIRDTGKLLRQEWTTLNKYRAERIAVTELSAAANAGSLAAANSTGLQLNKVWLSSPDERTRETHVAANGQKVLKHEQFEVGSARLMHPGDPSGPPEETIFCRCTCYFEPV